MNIHTILGGTLSRREKVTFFLLLILSIIFSDCYAYVQWNAPLVRNVMRVMLFFFFIWYIYKNPSTTRMHFNKEIKVLMVIPFLSSISSYIDFNQPLYMTAMVSVVAFTWITYYMLHEYKVSERVLLKLFFVVAIFIATVRIVQQFTYPNALFGIYSQEWMDTYDFINEAAEQRNGLWRFRISDGNFTAIILFAFWIWLRQYFSISKLFIVAILLTSIYLTLTRQIIASCLLTILLSGTINQKQIKILPIFLGLLLILGLYVYSDVLFGEFMVQTKKDANDDYIRLASATYFLEKATSRLYVFLLGYGEFVGASQYGKYVLKLNDMRFFISDVGWIGYLFKFGIIYLIFSFRILYKLFFTFRKSIPEYIRMVVLFSSIISIMIFPFSGVLSYFSWSLVLYISDLHINKSSLRLKSTIQG